MTEDVPSRIDVGKTAASPSEQLLSLSPIEIVMFDSKDNLMTGDILTAADPWRVCASLPKIDSISTSQELLGEKEAPFRNGKAVFDNLAFKELGFNQAIKFELCYAGSQSLDDLGFEEILSPLIDVINVDECKYGLDLCDENSNCTDLDGSYECICHEGFIGNGLICMQEIDECALEIDECDDFATCSDAPVGYTCACNQGIFFFLAVKRLRFSLIYDLRIHRRWIRMFGYRRMRT